MKKNYTLIILLFTISVTLNAQEKLPRFYWADMFDTLHVDTYTKSQIRQAIDSIDITTVSDEDFLYIEERFDKFQKRWMAKYGNVIPESNPATSIFVSGIECDRCEKVFRDEFLKIKGVEKLMTIDRVENYITYYYYTPHEDTIRPYVVKTLNERLEGCGYIIHELQEAEYEEVVEKVKADSIFKATVKAIECTKH